MLPIKKLFLTAHFLLIAGTSLTHAATTTTTITLQPDSAKECALCHYSWVDTFFYEKRSTEIATFPDKPMVAISQMCLSCHDGSTVDSRKKVYNDRKHQVGITPSDKIKIPEIFPLDEEGKMDCATCHSAHGVATESGIEKTIFVRTSNENSEMCKMCHVDKNGGPEKGNHPINKTSLKISREIVKYGGYIGSEPNQVICESCHVAHGGFTDKRLVLPVDRPGIYPVLCEACHQKTPGLNKEKSRNLYSHSVDVKPENAEIPKEWKRSGKEVRLGTRGELICVSCHSTHAPAVNESLLLEKNDKDSLCLQCHATQEKLIKESKHDLTLMAPEAKNVLDKTVSQSGPCSCCHLTHEGVGPFMWARKWEGKEEPPIGICKSCHAKGACAEESLIPETGHPIGVKPDEPKTAMDFPLFTETGKKDTKGAIYCSSCHNSHQWDPSNPDNKGSKDEKGDITNSFLRAAHQDSVLCLGCHKEKGAIEKTDHDLSLSAPDEKNKLEQSPGESGICGACHLAHGGAKTLMWARELEEGNDSTLSQLCLECHSEGSCAEKELTGEYSHPIEVKLEDTKEISFPLFSPEGKEDPQGMVFCSTCHNSHQWDPSDPDKKGEDGTSSDSFLRLTSDSNSPLCIECHRDQIYIEGTDHDLRVTAPKEKNRQGLHPQESGLCEQCHAAHNTSHKSFTWNRELGPPLVANWKEEFTTSENIMVGFCTGCHQEDGCAEEQIPEYGLHPSSVYMALMQEKSDILTKTQYEEFIDQFPIFTDEGEKSLEGNIVCNTCHDTHLWDAYHPEKGEGKETEGDATNSFLRKDISSIFCASCHGEEALYKFKYFHKIKGRTKD
jgi:predicted CXXCH cytochrome family protein